MNIHYCKYCNEPINMDNHGNTCYCPDKDCYKMAKSLRSLKAYHDTKDAIKAFVISDNILAAFYKSYGEDIYIPGILLDQAGMSWLISKSEITINDLPVKVLGNYGYCLFQNETVKIWKILSQPKENHSVL